MELLIANYVTDQGRLCDVCVFCFVVQWAGRLRLHPQVEPVALGQAAHLWLV